jgi:hypothetical protein
MNQTKLIGLTVTVLAVIGGVAVYNWARKPKKNSEGFFNAEGSSTILCVKPAQGGQPNLVTTFYPKGYCPKGYNKVVRQIQSIEG